MATTIFDFPANALVPLPNDEPASGDVPASYDDLVGRPCLRFDDTAEEAIATPEMAFPQGVTGTLTAKIHFFTISDNTNDVVFNVYVEAKTPDSDTLDMETADSWDTVNTVTKSVSGTTAGDPVVASVTLTNKDSVAAGDSVRFCLRRDAANASDDISGDVCVTAIEIQES
ncbi:MAG: hypothetical protein GWN00_19530 [Aliifodinibius sp.]|nr:hypothetical protein [Fodinibius sp.]NIY26916.1 hypothetical protein [Fodinibius sp.]